MFVAMNRFRVVRGEEDGFEEMWRTRNSRLKDVPGFAEFKLLKGEAQEDHTVYVSHSIWADRDAFIGWTKSEHFRKAHAEAGSRKAMYLGPPVFEGFESVVEE